MSNSFIRNIELFAKYPTINYYSILVLDVSAYRFVQKLKSCKNSYVIFPIDILLMVMRFEKIVWHLGHHPNLNTTRAFVYLRLIISLFYNETIINRFFGIYNFFPNITSGIKAKNVATSITDYTIQNDILEIKDYNEQYMIKKTLHTSSGK